MWAYLKLVLRIVFALADFAFLTGVAGVRVIATLLGIARDAARLRHAWDETVSCPAGHSNPTTGVFECGQCSGRYSGWVWLCPLCGSQTSYIACETCGLSIRSPMS